MTDAEAGAVYGLLRSVPLIEELYNMKPSLGGDSLETSALSSKVREGYELCIVNLLRIANRGNSAPMTSPFVDLALFDKPVETQTV